MADERARAVLEMLREPPEHMILRGAQRLPGRGEEHYIAAKDCWRSMVEEALGEG